MIPQASTLFEFCAIHPVLTVVAPAVILVILSLVIVPIIPGDGRLTRGTGQILCITPERDGWAVVDLWFGNDLLRVRTRDHERPTYSVGEPVLVFHRTGALGHTEVDRIKRLA